MPTPVAKNSAADQTVPCPNCGTAVPLTAALAAPLVEATRLEFEARLRNQAASFESQRAAMHGKESALLEQEQRLAQAQQQLTNSQSQFKREAELQREQIAAEVARQTEQQLAARLAAERKSIAEAETRRASERFADQIAERERDIEANAERIQQLTAKLSTAQAAETALKKREQEFGDKERELELRIAREVGGQLDQVRAVAASQAEERLSLQLSDKDRVIGEFRKQVEELQRKAQQGSQQAQGETLELVLEEQLRRHFPFDELQPVPKGEYGGDTLHVVRDGSGRECGRILWEFKRTKVWSAAWLPKLKGDQRAARADLAVIVTQAMPPDVQHFNEVDGVWVSSLSCTLPVATALRSSLMQLAGQRLSAQGQQTKSEMVYGYLTGPQFRARIGAIGEKWNEMQKDLSDEKKVTMKRWAKREKQLEVLLESTTGIYGDLHGIAGRGLAEIEALEDSLLLNDAV